MKKYVRRLVQNLVDATSPSRQDKEGPSVSDATGTSRPRGLAACVKSALALAVAVLLGSTALAGLYITDSAGKTQTRDANVTVKVGESATVYLKNSKNETYAEPAANADAVSQGCFTVVVPTNVNQTPKALTITGVAPTSGAITFQVLKSAGSSDTAVNITVTVVDKEKVTDFNGCTVTTLGADVEKMGNGDLLLTFKSSGTLALDKTVDSCDLLVVGGGAAGNPARTGDQLYGASGQGGQAATTATPVSMAAGNYTITVGGGSALSYKYENSKWVQKSAGGGASSIAGDNGFTTVSAAGGANAEGWGKNGGTAGSGGANLTSDITGESVTYGANGAAATSSANGTAGAANTGAGGVGGYNSGAGGAGGSGIVIVRLLVPRTVIPVPTAATGLIYNGQLQTGVAAGEHYTRGGDYEATAAGDYEATVTPDAGYCWPDKSYGAKTLAWSIARIVIEKPTAATGLVFTGNLQTGVAAGEHYTLGGTYQASAVGSYTAKATPDEGYCWPDKSYGTIDIAWSIARRIIEKPTAETGLVYDGTAQTGVAAGDHYTLDGTYQATDAGDYTATATPEDGSCWSDGKYGAITLKWSIARRSVTVRVVASSKVVGETEPVYQTQAEGFVADDAEATWRVWRTNLVEQLDGSLGLDERVGTYDLVIAGSPAQTKNYDIAYENGVGAFKILEAVTPVDAPTAVQGLVYDGTVQTGVVEGVGYTLTGFAERNAGNHSATATLQDGYCWTGGSTEAKTIPWFVAQLPIKVTPDAGQKKTVGKPYAITFTTNVTMVGTDRFTGALAVDEDVVGSRWIVLGTLAIDDGNEGANYALTFDDSVTIEVVADGPSMPTDDGTITYDSTKKEVVVTPVDGKKDVEIINMPSDATAKVPTSVDSVKGVAPAQIVVVADATNGTETVQVNITGAFTISETQAGVKIELNTNATAAVEVDIAGTKETVRVVPELTETGDKVVEPLAVQEATVELGAKTIPGLTYSLNRSTELGGTAVTVATEKAKGTRTKLTDPMDGGKPPQAFYVIEVTK